ncbi:3'(2'),5'-bisphosphate nucleotidase CysQ [Shewanella algae]|uniref:3'(2'),5'-bisphosphate nucleotidase CysQ n=1 Tax=Shewanella algae TaxID=38313 RepID=UPI001020072A|nr:3'(2'),5'-bisphosphate nucleotidase CysQ [Shewanella algae]MBO2677441.1 3'(2'),5'-bisphosphate nucleotidase CysQ [Shewanella algae]MDO8256036.1 3'(2'),5'-bisphosphate nucleotidase CysQ [Shewanella algae]QNV03842.1 3'(2'),5'-bisphosphate nucleotidase [Shewanella algae]TVL09145.1 3'(2'),5'-bisphosphate nucleotidase CysQ [Shewanella algae]
MKPEELIDHVIVIATEAGQKIRQIYQQGSFSKETKEDNTPVTSADIAAHEIICSSLKALTPGIPVLSEEAADIPLSERSQWRRYWLVDPLDGTGEFIAGSGDFSVIIALVEHNRPIMGVVYVPMTEVCYYAIAGLGAYKRTLQAELRIHSKQLPKEQDNSLRLAVSRRQDPQSVLKLFNQPKHCELVVLGGAALKSCLVAEGRADCYVRVGPTGEWDTGAAQIIIEEAGGQLMDTELQPLTYNERESLENPNFIVVGSPNLEWDKILAGD